MYFSDSVLEEIRSRIPVSEVVGKKVALKKRGREWIGLSPFTNEKTPSFTVNDQKGFYHCFSSGKNGNIFTFLMETEGLTFTDAVERLASQAGVSLPKKDLKSPAATNKENDLYAICEESCKYFEQKLKGSSGGVAREYLQQRGFSADIIKRFRLGYAPPERFGLRDHLSGKNYSGESVISAGMLIQGEDISEPFDRFRNRLIFPITDNKNRVIAFGARAMQNSVQPKYLNSPETSLFHKGSNLYNLTTARAASHSSKQLLVVEGYADVIALSQVGLEACVAPLGTALTEVQIEKLWKIINEPILCFDGDAAGINAASRAASQVILPRLKPNKSVRFLLMPDGLDPDDYVRQFGRHSMEKRIEDAIPLVEFIWQRSLETESISTPEKRAGFSRSIRSLAASVEDPDVRTHYQLAFKAKLAELFSAGTSQSRNNASPTSFYSKSKNAANVSSYRPSTSLLQSPLGQNLKRNQSKNSAISSNYVQPMRGETILLGLINHPFLLEQFADDLSKLEYWDKNMRDLQAALLQLYSDVSKLPELPAAPLTSQLSKMGHENALTILSKSKAVMWHPFVLPEANIVQTQKGIAQLMELHRRQHSLQRDVEAAKRAFIDAPNENNQKRFIALQEEYNSLEGLEVEQEEF